MVESVKRAVRILQELTGASPRLGVTDLAARLGISKSAVHGLLRTLESDGLVVQDAESGKYRLGPALVIFGNAYLDTHELRTRAVTWSNLLAARTGEAVWVGVLVHDEVMVVHHAFRPESVVQALETGATLPWSASALGKAVVAFSSEELQQRLLSTPPAALTGRTITEPAALAAQLARAREVGYALESQEATLGDAGIAAPVFDRTGAVAGAIGVIGPVERLLDDERRQSYAIATRETARNLSRELGALRADGRRAPF
ncbi:IclR family transcriptional regulator [Streptomyces regalis]|uniref:Glycerol operon regulatory protein n=1 Tax=Streptomyces regalis TaxID=68262 RepID=A0A0X3V4W7_9ACTN|nr:IclR family transcriptional regulator [Streptomyces regalis]KUL39718.1 IclR family transcriptional regulator [Streptomyces regalis]